jgi:peptide-methionine (S)-S-oxide reductase
MTKRQLFPSLAAICLAFFCLSLVAQESGQPSKALKKVKKPVSTDNDQAGVKAENGGETKTELATFGAGCFWCVEAVFQQVKGVESVTSGYIGGHVANPTYEQVCTGQTGHAEAIQVAYDPAKVSFDELLEIFWKTHDPTTLNRQGADVGTQYRSAVFYHNDEQKKLAEKYKQELDAAGAFNAKIVTEITAATEFYDAEKYHQDYFKNNPRNSYCQAVIIPKIRKFKNVFKDKLKDD